MGKGKEILAAIAALGGTAACSGSDYATEGRANRAAFDATTPPPITIRPGDPPQVLPIVDLGANTPPIRPYKETTRINGIPYDTPHPVTADGFPAARAMGGEINTCHTIEIDGNPGPVKAIEATVPYHETIKLTIEVLPDGDVQVCDPDNGPFEAFRGNPVVVLVAENGKPQARGTGPLTHEVTLPHGLAARRALRRAISF